jgi:hypothetical protein
MGCRKSQAVWQQPTHDLREMPPAKVTEIDMFFPSVIQYEKGMEFGVPENL